jgi:hypothetical protein
MSKGQFVCTIGGDSPTGRQSRSCVIHAETTNEARSWASAHFGREVDYHAIELRLVSGFPRLTEHDLKLGETVVRGDLFPLQDSPGWLQIDHEEQLDAMVRRWPVGVEAIPPFRAHARSKGQWRIPEFDEDRRRSSATIAGHLELDRQAGFGCD